MIIDLTVLALLRNLQRIYFQLIIINYTRIGITEFSKQSARKIEALNTGITGLFYDYYSAIDKRYDESIKRVLPFKR